MAQLSEISLGWCWLKAASISGSTGTLELEIALPEETIPTGMSNISRSLEALDKLQRQVGAYGVYTLSTPRLYQLLFSKAEERIAAGKEEAATIRRAELRGGTITLSRVERTLAPICGDSARWSKHHQPDEDSFAVVWTTGEKSEILVRLQDRIQFKPVEEWREQLDSTSKVVSRSAVDRVTFRSLDELQNLTRGRTRPSDVPLVLSNGEFSIGERSMLVVTERTPSLPSARSQVARHFGD